MKRNLHLTVLCLALLTLHCEKQESKEKPEKGLTYCRFGPKLTTHEETHSIAYDPCPGTVKIQGVLWKCEKEGLVSARLNEFLNDLTTAAQKVCDEHCKERSKTCVGSFRYQEKCGLSLDPATAEKEGRNFGCRGACDGRAFAYCSLYSAGFMPYDPELMKNSPANCVCTNQKKPE